ncbi:MAG TPA: hypothetical protein VJI46_04830 [Candidatus Nanoarchaeia archaeon]|nr:hypothetical protein [Candidatus Nanoarchaeia archaeon]
MKKLVILLVFVLILSGCGENIPAGDKTIPIVEDVIQNDTAKVAEIEDKNVSISEVGEEQAEEETEEPKVIDINDVQKIDTDVDLSSFPELFLGDADGKTVANAVIVVGKNAPAKDVISATIVATALNELVEEKGGRALTKLDDEVESALDRNAIVIGNPCDNAKAKELMGISDCNADLEPKKAMIRLYENNGFVQMTIVGYDAEGTYKAAQKLVDKTSALEGKFLVMGYS